MIEFIITTAVYWAVFALGVMLGRKKGILEERVACMKWAMRLNSKTLEIWQDEQSKNN